MGGYLGAMRMEGNPTGYRVPRTMRKAVKNGKWMRVRVPCLTVVEVVRMVGTGYRVLLVYSLTCFEPLLHALFSFAHTVLSVSTDSSTVRRDAGRRAEACCREAGRVWAVHAARSAVVHML